MSRMEREVRMRVMAEKDDSTGQVYCCSMCSFFRASSVDNGENRCKLYNTGLMLDESKKAGFKPIANIECRRALEYNLKKEKMRGNAD